MTEFLSNLKTFFTTVSGIVFLAESILLTVAFILCLIFSIFRAGYTIKNRVWFFLMASGVVCAEFGTSILLGQFGTGFIMLFIALIYFAIIISIRTVPEKATDKQKDFVRYLNQSIYRAENVYDNGKEEEYSKVQPQIKIQAVKNQSEQNKRQVTPIKSQTVSIKK